MAEFNIQSDSVDVTRIMEQIRQRIQEKRGRDYTEQQIHELATVKLERFLDPQQVRSDLVEHYRQLEAPEPLDPTPHESPGPEPERFDFNEDTIYASSRGQMGKLIRLIRKLLNPILKLFFNVNSVVFALSRQSEINAWTLQLLQQQADFAERVGKRFAAREELDALNYEVLNNLVVEMTRLSVDMKNHRSLVESVASRLDFDERRARALESVVQSRSPQPPQNADDESTSSTGSGRTRRRRRRSRRRPGETATPDSGTPTAAAAGAQGNTAQPAPDTSTSPTDMAAPDIVPRPNNAAAPASTPTVEPSAIPPETTPAPPATAPSPDPDPRTPPAVPPVANAGSPDPPPTPPAQGPSDAPAPATAPATETVARPSPPGDARADEQ